ncbi:hypothetical protein ACK6JO_001447 [Escherichia coli]
MPLEVGDLVDSPYGIGKLIRINNNDALIKYFDSPVNYEGIEQTVEVKHLKKAELHAESLVYRYDYEVAHWQIARVVVPCLEGYVCIFLTSSRKTSA